MYPLPRRLPRAITDMTVFAAMSHICLNCEAPWHCVFFVRIERIGERFNSREERINSGTNKALMGSQSMEAKQEEQSSERSVD